jgi:hypothetical protein
MSVFEPVVGFFDQVAPWFEFLLPTWLRSIISTVSSIGVLLASGVAVLLYRNQVFPDKLCRLSCAERTFETKQNRMLYHPSLPDLPRDPARNPVRLRNPAEWEMPYEDVEVLLIPRDGIKQCRVDYVYASAGGERRWYQIALLVDQAS